MRKRITCIGAILLLSGILAACGSQPGTSSGGTSNLSVAIYGRHASYWPIYIAQEKGFFSDQNVDVELVTPQAGSGIAQSVLSGSVDIGIDSPAAFILANIAGKQTAAIGALQDIPIGSLLVPPDSNFPNLKKGALVAVSNEKSGDAYIASRILAKHGLQRGRDYQYVSAGGTPERAASLTSGAVAAALIGQPDDFALMKKGFKRVGIADDVVTTFPWQWMMVNSDWAKGNSTVVEGFLKGLRKGIAWWYDDANRSSAVKILAATSNVPTPDAQKTYVLWHKKDAFSRDLELRDQPYRAVLEYMKQTKTLKQGQEPPQLKDFADSSYLKSAEDE